MEVTDTESDLKKRLIFINIIHYLTKNFNGFTHEKLAVLFNITSTQLDEIEDFNICRYIPYGWINIIVNMLTKSEMKDKESTYKPTSQQVEQFNSFRNILGNRTLGETLEGHLEEFKQIRDYEFEQESLSKTKKTAAKKTYKKKLTPGLPENIVSRKQKLKSRLDRLIPYLEKNNRNQLVTTMETALQKGELTKVSDLLNKVEGLQSGNFSINPAANSMKQSASPIKTASPSASILGRSLTEAITEDRFAEAYTINFTDNKFV